MPVRLPEGHDLNLHRCIAIELGGQQNTFMEVVIGRAPIEDEIPLTVDYGYLFPSLHTTHAVRLLTHDKRSALLREEAAQVHQAG